MAGPLVSQSALQAFLYDTVNLEVRISSDGRSKMCVIPGSQAKMAGAQGGVLCLLHGAQGQPGKKHLLRRSLYLIQKLL